MPRIDETRPFLPVNIAVLTISDTRTLEDDKSGQTLVDLIEGAGHKVADMTGGPWRLDSRETLATNSLVHADFVRIMEDILAGRGLEELPSPAEYAAARKPE